MKKSKLKSDLMFDFKLFGLICAEKEYKVAWLINQALKIRMVKQKDIELDFVEDKKLIISNFLFETDHSSTRLLKNKSFQSEEYGMMYLLPELPNFDYFIMAKECDELFPENFIRKALQPVNQISFVQQLDIDKLKSRFNLLF